MHRKTYILNKYLKENSSFSFFYSEKQHNREVRMAFLHIGATSRGVTCLEFIFYGASNNTGLQAKISRKIDICTFLGIMTGVKNWKNQHHLCGYRDK